MRKCIPRWLPGLLLMHFAHTGFTQQIDSMMAVYAGRLVPENIHIHFDKTIYNKGETIWFKIYLLQGGSDTTVASQNIYLDWYDAEGKPIRQTSAPVSLSTSHGSFDIPIDYKGQFVQVKAFTKWMLNDDPVFTYHRVLSVHNNLPATTRSAPNKTIVETFPEGGFLVQGLQTRMAFKSANQYGHPVFIKGVLSDDQDTIIDSLLIRHDDMGSFYLLPVPGRTYRLKWIDEYGVSGNTEIPVTKTEGAQISVTAANGKASFQVMRTEQVPENFKKMKLLVHMNYNSLYEVDINITEKTKVSSEIPTSELPTGLLQFTLFTSDWIPVAERVIFINNRSHEFNVTLAAPLVNVGRRGKNVLDITVPDALFTNMSMSITDAALNPPDQHSIFSDMFLSSEVKGKVYNPAYYFSGNTDHVSADLDLVMLTNAWRRYDWEKIKTGIPPKIDYTVETEPMKLYGKITGWKNNSSENILTMIVEKKDSTREIIPVPVTSDGSFEHPLFFFDTAKIYYSFNNQAALAEKSTLQIGNGLLKTVPGNLSQISRYPFTGNDSLAKQKLTALLTEQERFNKLLAATTLKGVTVTGITKKKEQLLNEKYATGFFSRAPGYVYDITDTKMIGASRRNVLDYLQGIIPNLYIRYNKFDDYDIYWRGDIPDFFVNEMRVYQDDMQRVLDIPMADIAMIKAFPPLFMYAPGGGRGGAIAVYTKKGGDYQVAATNTKGLETVLLPGYTQFREFYHPSYEQKEEPFTKPDNRTTLYWNPYITTTKTVQKTRVEFFNNDFTKKINVVLEGINAAGKMTRIVRTIDANTKNE